MIYSYYTNNSVRFPYGRGQFGRIPDAPEPPECPETFIEEICDHCSEYETCKTEHERREEEEDDD